MIMLSSLIRWRRMRRAAHEALTKRAVQSYHPIQIKEATILISSLLTPSANLRQDAHFKRLAASTIMSIVYDYPTVMSEHDHVIEKIETYNDRNSHAVIMGSYLVDIFPWMKHIPARCPGFLFVVSLRVLTENLIRFAKWKREGLETFAEDSEMFKGLLNRVKVDLVRIYLKMIYGAQLTDCEGQWGDQAKFLRVFDTESRSRFS